MNEFQRLKYDFMLHVTWRESNQFIRVLLEMSMSFDGKEIFIVVAFFLCLLANVLEMWLNFSVDYDVERFR